MPIYEFFCDPCNTVFNFFSKSINTKKRPLCPRCSRKLKRQVSLFACVDKSRKEQSAEDLPFDESRLEGAMSRLASEAEHIKEDDPRAAADLMRKFSDMTGVKLGNGMQEALRRMESGEDPEKIEAEMGHILESEDPFLPQDAKGKTRRSKPCRDETLYDL
ncbi:MAG: FmdB family zinc ribbon protein [Pseudomonadota bacterium]